MTLIRVELPTARERSDLRINQEYAIVNRGNRKMFYEGIIGGKDAFMELFGMGQIISWRINEELEFTDEGIVFPRRSTIELYELGSEEYEKNIGIVDKKRRVS